MKARPMATVATSLALLALLSGCADEAAAGAGEGVDDELIDLYDDTRNFLELTRDELIVALEERQEEFAALQRKLEAGSRDLEGQAAEEWRQQQERIEKLRAELAAGIVELKTSATENWTELREELVETTTALRRELATEALVDQR